MPRYVIQWDVLDGPELTLEEYRARAEKLRGDLEVRPKEVRLVDLRVVEGSVLADVEARDGAGLRGLLEGLEWVPTRVGEVLVEMPGKRTATRVVTRSQSRMPRLGDPLAFALLQWPAVVGLFELPGGWWGHGLRALLALWLLGTTSAAFTESRGPLKGFGVGIALNSVWFALIWWLQPHWSAWLLGGLIGLSFLALFSMVRDARKGTEGARNGTGSVVPSAG